jgi:outer membrane receptor protein involved in Fe transport
VEAPPQPQPQPQAQPQSKQTQTTPKKVQKQPELPQEEFVEEMVVTGSRIPRKELTTAAPVTLINREQLEATGRATIGEILQNLPEQSNATNTQVNNGGNGATRVNLRGLGTQRTLVLVNGRRHVAGGTGADDSVDLGAIPLAAIQRIEILKDGGSAIYGSDAIGGVVNIIMRKDFSGTELRAFSGLSSRGDGLMYDLGLTTGQISERGHLLFSASYYTQKEVWAGDRSYSAFEQKYDWASRRISTRGSTSIPEGVVFTRGDTNAVGNSLWGSMIGRHPGTESFILSEGEWRPFNDSGVQAAGGDLYNYQPANYLVTPQQRAQVFATGGLKVGDGARAYFEASYTNRQSSQKLAPEPLFTAQEGVVVSADNVYNPFGRDFVDVRRRLVEFGTRDYEQDLDTFRIVTGLEGTLSADFGFLRGWKWDTSFNHGRTQGMELKQGMLRLSRLQAAMGPSFIDPATGQARCGTPEQPIEGCVPINLFGGPGTITPEMKDYLSYRGTARGFTQQTVLQANAGGELFRLSPLGRAAGLALGYEHRRERGSKIPDPLTASGDTTGNKSTATEGGYYVNEGYLELSVPLLSAPTEDGTGRDVLELTGATRAFNYNTFGSGLTYKFGSRLSIIPDVTLRATYSTAFRAPSINQMFLGQTDDFPPVGDPCSKREQGSPVDEVCDSQGVPDDFTDKRNQLRVIEGGNPDLKPETAKVFTVGLVLEPRFLKDFSATLDYYNLGIDDAITNVTANVILANCYPTEAGAAPQYCDRIWRDADGYIQKIFDPQTNVGGDQMSGVDLALRYQPHTPYGRFGFSADVSYLHDFSRTLAGGKVVRARNTYDLLEVHADWKANLGVSWALDRLSASTNARWINGFKECEKNSCQVDNPSAPAPIFRQVESYYTLDANVAYNLETTAGDSTLQVGVNNLLDRAPAKVFNGFLANSDATTYDYMGRYFYMRLTHSFY